MILMRLLLNMAQLVHVSHYGAGYMILPRLLEPLGENGCVPGEEILPLLKLLSVSTMLTMGLSGVHLSYI